MARATTAVKSRTTPDTDAISFPVLTYTDALSRDDLRDINKGPAQVSEHGEKAQYDFPRPRNADGRKPPPGVAMASSFDFRVTAPPDEVFPSNAANDSPCGIPRIGVALGSPSMLDSRDNLPPPRFNTEIFSQDEANLPPLPRKSSKWKKIGGLFKAKNALAMPMNEPKVPPKQHATKQNAEQSKTPTQRRGSTEEWPKIEVDSTAAPAGPKTSPQRSRKFSLSGKKSNKPQPPGKGERSRLLDIDIPDVQMERYSVMFSQVMNKNQRPSLLARRSKTLDNLRVPNNQDFLAAKLPPVPQRRATSPARSSFTLFPTSQPSKAAQVLGTQNFSRGPSPLLRSNTLPVESPSKTSMEQTRAAPNINIASPFESPVVHNVFASHCSTPRSSLDKPLPVIKPELQAPQSLPRMASKLAVTQTANATQKPKGNEVEPAPPIVKQPAPAPNMQVSESPRSSPSFRKEEKPSILPVNSRRRSSSLAIPRTRAEPQAGQKPAKPIPALQKRPSQLPILQAPKPIHQERKSSLQAPKVYTRPPVQAPTKPQMAPQPVHQKERTQSQDTSERTQQPDTRPPRPNLRIQTKQQTRPRPPAKSGSSSSTLLSSTPPTGTLPTPNLSKDNPHRTPSPIIRSLSPQLGISPGGSSPRMPFVSEPEEIDIEIGLDIPKAPAETVTTISTIEVSIARSISVSRGKRQMLVPIAARVDHLHSNERFIERRPMTPRITDVSYGHKHAVSQELQIESL